MASVCNICAAHVALPRAEQRPAACRLLRRARGGIFAGFWWSHLKRSERRAFFDTLHRTLAPGAVVLLLDNLYVAGSSTPISHTDAAGNTYQQRALADGTRHVVLKNFPLESELFADVGASSTNAQYTAFDYYWMFQYAIAE